METQKYCWCGIRGERLSSDIVNCRSALFGFVVLVALLFGVAGVDTAWADQEDSRPSVLIVDSCLGDYQLAVLHWLGEDAEIVAEDAGRILLTKDAPAWWVSDNNNSSAPSTFLIANPDTKRISTDDLAWALAEIRETGAEPRTFVMAMGESGFALREYAEDITSQKQSDRADLVGLGFCGTPHNGYSAIDLYPEQGLWKTLADTAGLSLDDVKPGSGYLQKLNEGEFPRMTKTLNVSGSVGDLGFGPCDGAGLMADYALDHSVTNQVDEELVRASVSQQINLTKTWEPFTSSLNYPRRSLDSQLASRLSSFDCYETSDDVQRTVREFYDTWFSNGCPATHYSNVLLLDLSGSMNESIEPGDDKLASAKKAAAQYLHAMQACANLPQSAPMDVSIMGFNEEVYTIAEGFDQPSIASIEQVGAQGETNIEVALEGALSFLENSPTCASKRILILSDGESTRGMDDEQLLEGPIAAAGEWGIAIDTIGFGDVGESDADFLKRVSSKTGGEYYQVNDTYDLKCNFLKSYYASLGLDYSEGESVGGEAADFIGHIDSTINAFEVGIIGEDETPEVNLLVDGVPADKSIYTVTEDQGFVSIECTNPLVGDYELEFSNNPGRAHVFVVKQKGIVHSIEVAGEEPDYSIIFLIGGGALLLAALSFAFIRTKRKPRTSSNIAKEGIGQASSMQASSESSASDIEVRTR